jgi:hypothetical protein
MAAVLRLIFLYNQSKMEVRSIQEAKVIEKNPTGRSLFTSLSP